MADDTSRAKEEAKEEAEQDGWHEDDGVLVAEWHCGPCWRRHVAGVAEGDCGWDVPGTENLLEQLVGGVYLRCQYGRQRGCTWYLHMVDFEIWKTSNCRKC